MSEVLVLPEVVAPLEVLVEPPDPLSVLGFKTLLMLIGSGLDMLMDLVFSVESVLVVAERRHFLRSESVLV
jgi:hypothetical protein